MRLLHSCGQKAANIATSDESATRPSFQRALALDVGDRRIGLAVGDTETRLAVPSGHILRTNADADYAAVAKAARDRAAHVIVAGIPLNTRGAPTEQTVAVRAFIDALRAHTPLPIVEWDERFTTMEAERQMRSGRSTGGRGAARPLAKGDVDAAAAAVLLQSWLDAQRRESR